jgi:plastocyanin
MTAAACGGEEAPRRRSLGSESASGAAGGGAGGLKIDPATAGEVTGTVALDGAAPKNEAIRMNADPVCLKQASGPQSQETFTVGADGKSLANVFVYVKDGLSGSYEAPTTTITLDQKGCRYTPHIFGVQVGQPVEIVNSDPTLHNIHATPKANREFNNGQPIQGMKMSHNFTAKEVMVPFKCDVHGWMNAYVGVLDHPFFGVTDASGKFSLKGLPPGTYTIEAWHEKAGATTQSVTIAAKETKDITFALKAPATATN